MDELVATEGSPAGDPEDDAEAFAQMLDAAALAADAVVFLATTSGREGALTTTVVRALALGLHATAWKVRASSR